MSPILVRPVREQAEHDRLIRFLMAKYKRKFDGAASNIGDEQAAPVKVGAGTYFPDIVLMSGRKLMGVAEVESGESVNHLEALAQWVPFGKAKVPFALYVPVPVYDAARRLCEASGVTVAEIWTYRPTLEGFDLIRMFSDPAATRAAERAERAERAEKAEKAEKVEARKPDAKAPGPKATKPAKPAKKPAAKNGAAKSAAAPKNKKKKKR